MKKSINIPDHIFLRIQKLDGQSFTDKILGLVRLGLKKLNEEPEQKKPIEQIEDDLFLGIFTNHEEPDDFTLHWLSK